MKKTFVDVLLELPVDATLQQLLTELALPVPLDFAWDDTPETSRALLDLVRQWPDIAAKDRLIGELNACLPLADQPGSKRSSRSHSRTTISWTNWRPARAICTAPSGSIGTIRICFATRSMPTSSSVAAVRFSSMR